MDSNPQQAFPSLCSNGCGFFSTTDKDGLCSVCFKEKLKKDAQSSSPATTSSSTQTPPAPETSVPNQPQASSTSTSNPDSKETTLSESVPENSNIVRSEEVASAGSCSKSEDRERGESSPRKTAHPGDDDKDPVPAKKAKKNRCLSCKKKLGLTGFTCRCGGQFCSIHRYSDKHDCPFDYKAMGEQEISQNNPQIVAQKVAKL